MLTHIQIQTLAPSKQKCMHSDGRRVASANSLIADDRGAAGEPPGKTMPRSLGVQSSLMEDVRITDKPTHDNNTNSGIQMYDGPWTSTT